jgi:hypothetical protein
MSLPELGGSIFVITEFAESFLILGIRPLAACRRAIFRGVKRQFEPLRAPGTRRFKGFLSDLRVLRGKKTTLTEFSDSLLVKRKTVAPLNPNGDWLFSTQSPFSKTRNQNASRAAF